MQVQFLININMEYKECKNQKKIPEKGHRGTYFQYKKCFHTVSFYVSKEQIFIFRKIYRIKFSSWKFFAYAMLLQPEEQ